jgi:hypothetical protein
MGHRDKGMGYRNEGMGYRNKGMGYRNKGMGYWNTGIRAKGKAGGRTGLRLSRADSGACRGLAALGLAARRSGDGISTKAERETRNAQLPKREWPKWEWLKWGSADRNAKGAAARAANASLPFPRRRRLPFAVGSVCARVCVWLRPKWLHRHARCTHARTHTHARTDRLIVTDVCDMRMYTCGQCAADVSVAPVTLRPFRS